MYRLKPLSLRLDSFSPLDGAFVSLDEEYKAVVVQKSSSSPSNLPNHVLTSCELSGDSCLWRFGNEAPKFSVLLEPCSRFRFDKVMMSRDDIAS